MIKVIAFLLFCYTSMIFAASTDSFQTIPNIQSQIKPQIMALPKIKLPSLTSFSRLDQESLFNRSLTLTNQSIDSNNTENHVEQLVTHLIVLHYADAKTICDMLKKNDLNLLSPQGRVSFDEENNTLWVRDLPDYVPALLKLIAEYDQPVSQIYIKAKIINVDEEYVHSLGIAFKDSVDNSLSEAAGGLENLVIPIANLSHNFLLEATIDALEKQGHARLISNPQLITLNRQSANIEAGEEVPYQQTSYGGGTTVAFKKAVLRLQVTPSIMPHQKILLHLKINQDQVGALTINGVPAINTQELETQVYMQNKSTLVLGGIFEQSNSQEKDQVPGLNHIPVVKSFFSHNNQIKNRKQLLIFVTPVIVKQ